MITDGVVISIEGETAVVRIRQRAACVYCHKNCATCGKNAVHDVVAENECGATVGELVWVNSPSSLIYLLVILLYLLPLFALPTVYLLAEPSFGEGAAAVISFCATLSMFAIMYLTACKSLISKNKYSIIRKI